MKLMLDTQSPYIIKYAMRDGNYYVDDTMLKISGYRAWRRWRQSQEGEPVL